jgi:drug/metabolite transporter (DMT)-like permease
MLVTTLIWGANFSVVKLALREIPPIPLTGIRFVTGSFLLGLTLIWQGRLRRPPAGLLRPLIIYGLIGNTVYQLCFINGLARTSATNSALILASLPTMVTLSAAALGLEHPSRRQFWGVVLATTGVALVVQGRARAGADGGLVGDGLMLAATCCWTAYSLGLRTLSGKLPPLELTAWTLFTGTPGLVVVALPGLLRLEWAAVSPAGWGAVAYSAILSLTAAYFLWSRSIRQLGAGPTAIYSCAVPLVAAVVAILLLGEHPTWLHFAGGALIVSGVLRSRGVRLPAVES